MSEPAVDKSNDAVWQTEKAEITPLPARRYRTLLFYILLVSAILAFSFLTFLVETIPSFPIDLQITLAIQSIDSPFFANLMWLVSWPGFLPQSIIITLLIALLLYLYGLRWESAISLLAALVSGVSNEMIKGAIQRPRPAINLVDVFEVLTSYSFPSGHVMLYTILFGFLWFVVYTMLKRSWLRSLLLVLLGSLILFVGVSRIYLGQHWASDVLGAYLLGSLILSAVILLHRWGKTRFFLRPPAELRNAEIY
jgi:membrane-associated phospholipid phosphatase